MRKVWGGAFDEDQDALVDRFGQSFESDLTFWREDVEGSIAHATMLGSVGLISREDSDQLVGGLRQILAEGAESLPHDVEDVHTAVEVRLREIIGPVAGKLHMARSRNDQVATDLRLYMRRRLGELGAEVSGLQRELLEQASAHGQTVLPGVTHQQHAQPITLGFHLLAHFWAMQRHRWRLRLIIQMVNWSPLGSAALAGTGFPIDRQQTAELLGFAGPLPNALDATSDRSIVLDAHHWVNLVMLDLSRLCQELVLWSTPEYGYLSLSDKVTTGSSIMPQKRNPDMAELIRGKAGHALGRYVALSATMKGLILGYNRDTQEDKPPLFESLQMVEDSLRIATLMLEEATWNPNRMVERLRQGFAEATDLADALALRGMPFREAHEVVGRIVRFCLERGLTLDQMDESMLAEATPEVPYELLAELDPVKCALRRNSYGGPGSQAMARQMEEARAALDAWPTSSSGDASFSAIW